MTSSPAQSPGGLCRRIIPCLDVDSGGRTVKGVRFQGLRDIGDPLELALRYQEDGADELLFLDISASHEGRRTLLDVVSRVGAALMIPFTVGGGVGSLDEAKELLGRGADKVAVNTRAVANPQLIEDIATECGSQCCVLAIDARRAPGGAGIIEGPRYEVLTHGGRRSAGKGALEWAREAVGRGAGEILLTSWDQDGTEAGFDLMLTRLLSEALPVPVIASGGAAGPRSFIEVFQFGRADAALAASIFHDGKWTPRALKQELHRAGIEVRT